jgi:hypothetical protein
MNNKYIYLTLFIAFIGINSACDNTTVPKADTSAVENPISADMVIMDEDTAKLAVDTNADGAIISFEKTVHDFGTITEGEKAEYSFKFVNTGTKQLLISNASASCGCTVPSFTRDPIEPGSTGYIKVVFDSKYRTDMFEKTVMVLANTTPAEHVLTIKGFVFKLN